MIAAVFSALSILAIIAGGMLSAFSARRPTRSTAWASAYLGLVVGIIQLGLVTAWQRLGAPSAVITLVALLAYNLGHAGVMTGTLRKQQLSYYRRLVNIGGSLIAAAMALLLVAIRRSPTSWTLVGYIILIVIIIVSMPIGLMLSHRRHKLVKGSA